MWQQLTFATQDADPEVRLCCVEALGCFGEDARPQRVAIGIFALLSVSRLPVLPRHHWLNAWQTTLKWCGKRHLKLSERPGVSSCSQR